MVKSPLAAYMYLSPNNSGERTAKIDRITPHCVVGQCTAETLGNVFANPDAMASANYGIDRLGRIGLYVPEECRSWCSSSAENDQRAITIECASDTTAPYRMNDCVYSSLVLLCTDICKRYGKTRLLWISNKAAALAYTPKENEMLLTVHRWFAAKECPGEWLYSRLGALAEAVTDLLEDAPPTLGPLYRVQVGAFRVKDNAERLRDHLKESGFSDAFIVEAQTDD